MTHLYACTGCAIDMASCHHRRNLKAAVAGLRVHSIKHTCPTRVALYSPGCAVEVETVPWLVTKDGQEEDTPIKGWYRGVFIEQLGSKALAFIKPGQIPADGDEDLPFEGTGIVKVPLTRLRPVADATLVDVTPCQYCSAITSIGQPCGSPGDFEFGRYSQPSRCQMRSKTEAHSHD